MSCPVCGHGATDSVVELENVPVFCNQLHSSREGALAAARGQISLEFCPQCSHLFNARFDAALVAYSPDYENTLHCSGAFRQYASQLTGDLSKRHSLAGKTLVEIGCGDGQFLRELCARSSASGVGFDPSYQGVSGELVDGVTIHRTAYGEAPLEFEPGLVCSRHCLEHIEAPVDFLRVVRQHVPEGTPVYVEVPNALFTLRDGGIWDILYEHCGYFTPQSLAAASRQAGIQPVKVEEVFSGQFLALHAVAAAAPQGKDSFRVEELAKLVAAFKRGYEQRVSAMSTRLRLAQQQGKVVAIWGAGTKGVMLLNTAGTGSELVVDLNPKKHGMFVAGTGQRICAPEALKDTTPDIVLVMNPVYREEIREQLGTLGLNPQIELA